MKIPNRGPNPYWTPPEGQAGPALAINVVYAEDRLKESELNFEFWMRNS